MQWIPRLRMAGKKTLVIKGIFIFSSTTLVPANPHWKLDFASFFVAQLTEFFTLARNFHKTSPHFSVAMLSENISIGTLYATAGLSLQQQDLKFWSSELRQLQGMSNSLDTFLLKTFMWVYDPDQVISFNIGE